MLDFTDHTVLVLGLGESGLAIARWVGGRGAKLRVADTRDAPPMLGALRHELPSAQFHGGAFDPSLLDGITLVALSPGLSPTHSAAAPLVTAARERGLPVVGEIELFARALAELAVERGYQPRVVGVTGTNGKTTTTRLAGLLIAATGRRVAVAGNISPTALDTLAAHLAADDLPEVWLLELSSFQLATTESLVCDAAAVLNITQDHLDWHGTMEAYASAKARIFGRLTQRVLNRDDARVLAMQPVPPAARRQRARRPPRARKATRVRALRPCVLLPGRRAQRWYLRRRQPRRRPLRASPASGHGLTDHQPRRFRRWCLPAPQRTMPSCPSTTSVRWPSASPRPNASRANAPRGASARRRIR
jgi:UDP-N-acetylmuramoylalanine-D-glutamate ligase